MEITIGINANHAKTLLSVYLVNKLIFAIEEERLNESNTGLVFQLSH